MTRQADAGFSLLEVLVVLALLATVSGATLVSFRASAREEQPRTEATILASRLSLAADEALVAGGLFSLHLDATGYNVDQARGDEWIPYSDEMFGARHEVPKEISMRVEGDSERVRIRPDALGDRTVVTFSDADGDGAWRVSFDGLAARAEPVER